MPKDQQDALFSLIKSLTKGEKRYFSLYTARQQSSEDARYMKLFDILDKQKTYDEEGIFKREETIRPSQLSNLKAHLYAEILTALRLFHAAKNEDMLIREQIDFAKLLYNRGLVSQSLKILDKTKAQARNGSHFILALEILQFEKDIEARHITRSLKGRAQELEAETTTYLATIDEVAKLSSLSLELYSLYLQNGHVQSEKDSEELKRLFKEKLSRFAYRQTSFFGQAFLHQAYCWYYYMMLELPGYYRHSVLWVRLFEDNPKHIAEDPFLYLKGLHNLINSLFVIGNHLLLEKEIQRLSAFYEEAGSYNENLQIQAFLYLYTAKINYHFSEGSFTKGLAIVPDIEAGLQSFARYIDIHRVMIFYYKIASLYFGAGRHAESIDYLNKVINLKVGFLRSDLQCFARLLHLIAHYELGNMELLEYLIKSVYRFLSKMEGLDAVQEEILRFLRRSLNSRPKDVTQSFKDLRDKLAHIAQNRYSTRSYQYLDVVSWLESKIERLPVEEVIRDKFLKNNPSPVMAK